MTTVQVCNLSVRPYQSVWHCMNCLISCVVNLSEQQHANVCLHRCSLQLSNTWAKVNEVFFLLNTIYVCFGHRCVTSGWLNGKTIHRRIPTVVVIVQALWHIYRPKSGSASTTHELLNTTSTALQFCSGNCSQKKSLSKRVIIGDYFQDWDWCENSVYVKIFFLTQIY